MREAYLGENFYPFIGLNALKPLDSMPIDPKNFHISIGGSNWKFRDVLANFTLNVSSESLDDNSSTDTPLGEVPVNYVLVDGKIILKKAPVYMHMQLTSDSYEGLVDAQWYKVVSVIGENMYYFDTTDDFDSILQGDPKKIRPLSVGSILLPTTIALPYDLEKLKTIPVRFEEISLLERF